LQRRTKATASSLDCCDDYASPGDSRTRRKRLQPWSAGPLSALSLINRVSLSRFRRAKNQRYRANGSHDRYLVTVNRGIGTRKAGR
jgi:hypothetical protein